MMYKLFKFKYIQLINIYFTEIYFKLGKYQMAMIGKRNNDLIN